MTDAIVSVIPYAAGLLLLWLLMRMTDASLVTTVRDLVHELNTLGRISPKGINMLGGILLFALVVFLFFGGLAHIALPDPKHSHATGDASRLIYLGVVIFFGAYFLISIAVTKTYK